MTPAVITKTLPGVGWLSETNLGVVLTYQFPNNNSARWTWTGKDVR